MKIDRKDILVSVAGTPLIVVTVSVAAVTDAMEVAFVVVEDWNKTELALDWTDTPLNDAVEWTSGGDALPETTRRRRV